MHKKKGVDYLIARGLIDKDKLGVMGWSNGSLLAIELTTRTTRYKAAGAGAGVVDWTSDWANAYFGASFNNNYFGVSPLENHLKSWRISPSGAAIKPSSDIVNPVRTLPIAFSCELSASSNPGRKHMFYRQYYTL